MFTLTSSNEKGKKWLKTSHIKRKNQAESTTPTRLLFWGFSLALNSKLKNKFSLKATQMAVWRLISSGKMGFSFKYL